MQEQPFAAPCGHSQVLEVQQGHAIPVCSYVCEGSHLLTPAAIAGCGECSACDSGSLTRLQEQPPAGPRSHIRVREMQQQRAGLVRSHVRKSSDLLAPVATAAGARDSGPLARTQKTASDRSLRPL